MKLIAQLTALRLFDALTAAGVIDDPAAVNRVVIDARRGDPVVIHVETVAGTQVLDVTPLLGGSA